MSTTSPSLDVPDTGLAARGFKPGPGFYVLVCLIVLTIVLALSAAITSALGVTGTSRVLGGTALILVGLGMLASLRVSARSLVVNAPRLRLERNRVRAAQARQRAESAKSAKSAKGKADKIDIPDGVVNHYPIAQTASPENAAGAKVFIDAVTDKTGQEVLAKYGFGKPGSAAAGASAGASSSAGAGTASSAASSQAATAGGSASPEADKPTAETTAP